MCSSGDFFNLFEQGEENDEMVKWIGKFSLLLKHLRGAWMDLLPTSSTTSEQVTR